MTITLDADIASFFDEIVHDAVRSQGVEATEGAIHYVVGVLCEYARPDPRIERNFGRPLTFIFREAIEASGTERFHKLQKLGDAVLYTAGFFGSNIISRGADRTYVISLGSSAYGHASAMLRFCGAGDRGPDVLGELADKFSRFVNVITEVADSTLARSYDRDSRVLSMYERWLETGSARLADELGRLGLIPRKPSRGVN